MHLISNSHTCILTYTTVTERERERERERETEREEGKGIDKDMYEWMNAVLHMQ